MPRSLWSGLAAVVTLFASAAVVGQAPEASTAVFQSHAVAADNPHASAAGLEILEAGGNAADAAAATMLALGVASPTSSGLGGGGFALYYRAADRSLTFLDFRETAPAAATSNMFARREGDDDQSAAARSQTGGLAVAVPGEPAGIERLITQLGSGRVTRARITEPAERLAREGVPVSRHTSTMSGFVASLMRLDALLAGWLDGDRMPVGMTMRSPALAATLRSFGRSGARAIYRGAIARQIVSAVRARDGIVTLEDLAGYTVRERAPLEGMHFGHRWVTAPPPSAGGYTLLHSLALLERWQPEQGWRRDAAYLHALSQSWIGAFADRAAYFGDPDHVEVPLPRLLDPARLDARAARFDRERALDWSAWSMPLDPGEAPSAEAARDQGTSHLCVVDREGNVAAVTTTINAIFGARVSAAGIILNDEMDDFAREPGAANLFGLPGGEANLPGPGRRPVSTMTPTIVFDGDRPVLCAGGSGGSTIVTGTEQVALDIILLRLEAAEAIRSPRVHHQGLPATLRVEDGIDAAARLALWRRGHDLTSTSSVANVQVIHIVARDGARELHGASDPRKGGEPRGR